MRINSYRMALILTVRSKGTHHVKLRQGRQVWLSKPLATLGKDFDSSVEKGSFFLALISLVENSFFLAANS